MLFVNSIIKIVKLGIASSFLKDERTKLSVILLGNPEIGKSSILLNFDFRRLKGVKVLTDITKTKIESLFLELKNEKSPMGYLIIPDLTRLYSHSQSTQKGIIGVLNSGIEEGLREITTYVRGFPVTTYFNAPLHFGIATSMTRSTLKDRRKQWYKIGFLSRLLPVSFSYTKEQAKKIREYIGRSKDLFDVIETLKLKPSTVKCSYKHVHYFDDYIERLAEAQLLYGFRFTKQFRLMLKANALLKGSSFVTKKDVMDVEKLMRYINLDYNSVE